LLHVRARGHDGLQSRAEDVVELRELRGLALEQRNVGAHAESDAGCVLPDGAAADHDYARGWHTGNAREQHAAAAIRHLQCPCTGLRRETAGDLTVIDVTRRETVARIVHGGGDAMGLALSPDGRVLYAAAGENKAVIKIDTTTNKEISRIKLPGIVHEATLTADGKFMYTTLRKANRVVVVRTADDTIVATIRQKGFPDLVTMEPSGRYALVTNRYADHVSVIDLATHTQVRAIPVGKAPHGMALRPR